MILCPYCNRDVLTGAGCTDAPLVVGGQPFSPIRHGDETRFVWAKRPGPCHDCGVPAGQVHHHCCTMEECPSCREQLIGCDCLWPEDEDEDEDPYCGDPEDFDWDDLEDWASSASLGLTAAEIVANLLRLCGRP